MMIRLYEEDNGIDQWEERKEQRILSLQREYGLQVVRCFTYPERICEECGGDYYPKMKTQKYCTNKESECGAVANRRTAKLARDLRKARKATAC